METENLDELVVDEIDEQPEVDEAETETEEEETEEESEVEISEEEEEDEDAEDVIEIEGITPPDQEQQQKGEAPEWLKETRRRNKELNKQVKEYQEQLEQMKARLAPLTNPLDKPKLEDFEYDTDEFDKAIDQWVKDKEAYAKQEEQAAKVAEANQREFNQVIENYDNHRAKLKVQNYDVAEAMVEDTLSHQQQAVLLKYAQDPAKVVYALGTNKSVLDELAATEDPIAFALAMNGIQSKLKVTKRRAPKPETKLSGGANASGVDSTLERLREEGRRTGDMSKVIAYKRQQKHKG